MFRKPFSMEEAWKLVVRRQGQKEQSCKRKIENGLR